MNSLILIPKSNPALSDYWQVIDSASAAGLTVPAFIRPAIDRTARHAQKTARAVQDMLDTVADLSRLGDTPRTIARRAIQAGKIRDLQRETAKARRAYVRLTEYADDARYFVNIAANLCHRARYDLANAQDAAGTRARIAAMEAHERAGGQYFDCPLSVRVQAYRDAYNALPAPQDSAVTDDPDDIANRANLQVTIDACNGAYYALDYAREVLRAIPRHMKRTARTIARDERQYHQRMMEITGGNWANHAGQVNA